MHLDFDFFDFTMTDIHHPTTQQTNKPTTTMRVLVLHPQSSSVSTLHTTLYKLEEKLWTQHGIELVFVDAPLLDVTVGRCLGCDGTDNDGGDDVGGDGDGGGKGVRSGGESGLNEIEESEIMSRRWYVKEECIDERRTLLVDDKDAANNKDNNNNNSSINSDSNNNNSSAPQHTKKKKKVQYSGLDASLLHLTQIWSRGGASSSGGLNNNEGMQQQLPFQGILGFGQGGDGQGGDVAAMLPLLNHAGDAYNNNDNEEEEEESINMEGGKKCIFEGLQFVILVDGRDIMNQEDDDDSGSSDSNNNNGDDDEEEDSWYVGPNGISSLHLIAETTTANDVTTNNSKRQSELLAKRYGSNATIQYYKPNTKKTNNKSPSSSSTTTQKYNTPTLHNLLGHHLVLQKKILLSNPTSRKLLSLQTQLYTVEQLATVAITNEIKRNPPKCLMAMIGPSVGVGGGSGGGKENCQNDDKDNKEKIQNEEKKMSSSSEREVQIVGKTVGAWQGPGRVFGEQGGGAPCPESFLLRQEDRVAVAGEDVGSSGGVDGGDKKKKSSVTVTASLL
jgi:hypothetical protein